MDKMKEIDVKIAGKIGESHEKIARRANLRRMKRPPYAIGDWVWLIRPKPVGGVKLQTWWRGPYLVEARVGEASYKIKIPQRGLLEVHADQLKPCVWERPADPIRALAQPAPSDPNEPKPEME